MTLKEYIYKLNKETRQKSDEIDANEKKLDTLEYLRQTARNTGKLQILNKIMQFIIENDI